MNPHHRKGHAGKKSCSLALPQRPPPRSSGGSCKQGVPEVGGGAVKGGG